MDERITVSRSSDAFWFAMVDIDVLRDAELSMTAKFVYTVICTFASTMTGRFWPGIERVARTAGLDIETVEAAYRELEKKRILSNARRQCIEDTHTDKEG